MESVTLDKIIVKEVDERMVGQVRRFLASRDEFAFSNEWTFLFDYSWKLDRFPYGYVILDGDKIAGFLGTIFSERVIQGKKVTHCNITTWIVDGGFRSRLGAAGKGLGQVLIDPVLEMGNILITATTPNDRSRKSCEKLGFKVLEREQIMVSALPWPFIAGRINREHVLVTFDPDEIDPHLGERDREILADHRKLVCTHFLIKGSDGRYCYGVGTQTLIKKLVLPAFRCLNLCYLSDSDFFVEHMSELKKRLWIRDRIMLLRYDARLIRRRLSAFEYTIPRIRLFKHPSYQAEDLDNLYTELVTRNSY